MLNSLYCTLDQLIIARSTTPQNDEAFIDVLLGQELWILKLTCLTRRKERKEKGSSEKTRTLDWKNRPIKPLDWKKRIRQSLNFPRELLSHCLALKLLFQDILLWIFEILNKGHCLWIWSAFLDTVVCQRNTRVALVLLKILDHLLN